MHVPKINATIPAKPVSGIFNPFSLYPRVLNILCEPVLDRQCIPRSLQADCRIFQKSIVII